MSSEHPTSIRIAPVVAVILGLAALPLIAVTPGLYPFALVLAIAGFLVGGISVFNNRQDRVNLIASIVAVAVSLVAVILVVALVVS